MKVLIFSTKKEAVEAAVKVILKQVKTKPNSTLGLASGSTVIPIYNLLSKKTSMSKTKTFNLDEYTSTKNTLRKFMQKHLFIKTKIKKQNIHFPNAINPKNYDREIENAGGIDLQILGIGQNGHIAFNEPCSQFSSKTRKIKLSSSTRKSNSHFFKSPKQVPTHAVTMGLATIMSSKKIILIATGKNKAEAIAKTILSKPSAKTPASILQNHKDTIIILDKTAASGLKK